MGEREPVADHRHDAGVLTLDERRLRQLEPGQRGPHGRGGAPIGSGANSRRARASSDSAASRRTPARPRRPRASAAGSARARELILAEPCRDLDQAERVACGRLEERLEHRRCDRRGGGPRDEHLGSCPIEPGKRRLLEAAPLETFGTGRERNATGSAASLRAAKSSASRDASSSQCASSTSTSTGISSAAPAIRLSVAAATANRSFCVASESPSADESAAA